MSNINIIVAGRHHTFREPVIGLEQSLKELGHTINSTTWYEKRGDRIRLGKNNLYIGALFRRTIPVQEDKNNIYLCTEQYHINTPADASKNEYVTFYNNERERFNVIIDMFRKSVTKPIKAVHRYCPIGWSPIWEENYDPNLREKIDLLHLGGLQIRNTKRTGVDELATKRIAYGLQRDRTIQHAKINLSLQTFSQGYEWTPYRMLYVVGKRKFLMADEHIDYGVYEPGKNFIVFEGNDINKTYNEWINKPKERRDFGIAAYEDIKENHQFSMYLDKALDGLLL